MNELRWKITVMSLLLLVVTAILFVSECFYGYYSVSVCALAATTTYSDVLDDLEADESFTVSDYPVNVGDYTLQVIALAESSDCELFVYVYQPSGSAKDFTASSINISRSDISTSSVDDEIRYYNYGLTKLSSSGTLYKYLVEDFVTSTAEKRYYSITSIYRPFDETIDTQADYDNIITEVNYAVSKEYCFSTVNGETVVDTVDIETITITDKFVGFVRYVGGVSLSYCITASDCDAHFVAFDTDKDIDKLLEADVYYTSQSCEKVNTTTGTTVETGDEVENYAYLTNTQVASYTSSGFFAATYTWNRIETVKDFISGDSTKGTVYEGYVLTTGVATEITDEGLEALEGKKWILHFVETDYSVDSYTLDAYYSNTFNYTMVGDVTILRLKFITDGVTYNLGVLDNKQTGSDDPINSGSSVFVEVDSEKLGRWVTIILLIIGGVVFVLLLSKFVSVISNASSNKKINEIYKSTSGNKKRRKRRKRK